MVSATEIKDARSRLGESQASFGRRFNVDQSTIHRWETDGPPDRGLVPVTLRKFLNEMEVEARA